MRISAARHNLIFKIVSIAIVLSMTVNDIAFGLDRAVSSVREEALSPGSRFGQSENFILTGDTTGHDQLGTALKHDAALIYTSRLIGRALETARSADNISAKALQTLIRGHLGHIGEVRFDISSLHKEGRTFCLPLDGEEQNKLRVLRYYLPSDSPPETAGKSSINVGTGKARVIIEETVPGFGTGHEVKLLLPAAGTTHRQQKYGEEFRKYMDLDSPEEREYLMQGTFERAMEYEEGKTFSSSPWQFMLYAIETYASDTPKNDLALVPIWLGDYTDKLALNGNDAIEKSLDDVLAQLELVEKSFPSSIKGGDNIYIGDIGDEEAKETVRSFLKLRDNHLGSIDKLIETIKREAPELELLRDISAYYRTRVVDFFDELEKRSSAMDVKDEITSSLESHEAADQDPAIKDEKAFDLLEDFIEAIQKGKYQKGRKVDLRELPSDKEIIIIGDLHERNDKLSAILNHRRLKPPSGGRAYPEESVLDKISNGRAVLVILGDAVHADRGVADPISLSMVRSLDIMETIMNLKVRYPDHVYYVLGNHDDPDTKSGKYGLDPRTGEGRIIPQGRMYKEKLRKEYGEAYLERYRDLINESPLRVVAKGLVALHAGPPKGMTIDEIEAIEHKDIGKDASNDKKTSTTMLWGRYKGDERKRHDRLPEPFEFTSGDIDRYLAAEGQPGAFFVVAHTPDMVPRNNFYKEFGRNRFVIYAANDVTGYFSYRGGVIEAVDASYRIPVATYYNPGSREGSGRVKRMIYTSAGFIALLGIMALAVFLSSGGEALLPAGISALFAFAGMLGMAGAVPAGHEEFDGEKFLKAAQKINSPDEYIRMAGARDLASMDIPHKLKDGDPFISEIEEFMLGLLAVEKNEYINKVAARYLARLGAHYPLSERAWKGLLEKAYARDVSTALRAEILMFFAGTISMYPEYLLQVYKLGGAMLITPGATDLHVIAVRMMGNLIRHPYMLQRADMAAAFSTVAEIASTGAVNAPINTGLGIYVQKKEFESPRIQQEAIDQLYGIFDMELKFMDLVLSLQGYTPSGTIRKLDVGKGGTVTLAEINAATGFPVKYVWKGSRQTFEAICLLLFRTIRDAAGQKPEVRAHAASTVKRMTRRRLLFIAKKSSHKLTRISSMEAGRELTGYIGGVMYPAIYGEKGVIEEPDNEVALSLAETFIEFAGSVNIGEARRVLESVVPRLFLDDPVMAERAKKTAITLYERFPDLKKDKDFTRLKEYLYGKPPFGKGGLLLAVLPWIVLAAAFWGIMPGITEGLEYAALGFLGIGAALYHPERPRGEDAVEKSLDHMFHVAARSVYLARNNEDVMTREESRLQICPVDYLTDPDNVDLTAAAHDNTRVYSLIDRMHRGDLSGADTDSIKIHVNADGDISIWNGKHRLEALRRMRVPDIAVHVIYKDPSVIGKHPFRDITDSGHMRGAYSAARKEHAVSILDPALMREAEDMSLAKEVERINNAVGMQQYYSKEVERWGVYTPTPTTITLNVLQYMKSVKPDASICDLGSGAGRFAFMAAMVGGFDFREVTGIEARENLYQETLDSRKELKDLPGSEKLTFINGDFLEEDLSGYDLLYFFYTSPSGISQDEFKEKFFRKLTGPTGMKPGARLVVWGHYEDFSDGEKLVMSKVKLGGLKFDVYTRAPGEDTPPGAPAKESIEGAVTLRHIFVIFAIAASAVLAAYFMRAGGSIVSGVLWPVLLGSVVPLIRTAGSGGWQRTAETLLGELANADEIVRMRAAYMLSRLDFSGDLVPGGAFTSYAERVLKQTLMSDEPGEMKKDLLLFARNLRKAFPGRDFLDGGLAGFLAYGEEEEALKREAVRTLLAGHGHDRGAVSEACWGVAELLVSAGEEETRLLCVKALADLFDPGAGHDDIINRRIFSVLEEIAELGRVSFIADIDSDRPDRYVLFSEEVRVEAVRNVAKIHIREIHEIEDAFNEGKTPRGLAKVLSENFQNRYRLFSYLVSGSNESFHPIEVRVQSAAALREISGAWHSLFRRHSIKFADDSAAARYVDDMRAFMVSPIYDLVYGNDSKKIERDTRVRLMVSGILAEYGLPEIVPAGAIVRALEPMVFDEDDSIAARAAGIIINVINKDAFLRRDRLSARLLRICRKSLKDLQPRGGLWLIAGFAALTAHALISDRCGLGIQGTGLAGLLMPSIFLAAALAQRSKGQKESPPGEAPPAVASNPYGEEKYVARRFLDLDNFYMRDISQEIISRINRYDDRGRPAPPVKVLMIGVGRGLEAFDLMHEYGDRLEVTITAKEDLLYDARELREKSGYLMADDRRISPEQAELYVKKARKRYIMCDMDDKIDLDDGYFDIVIMASGMASYVKDKWKAIKETIRVCNDGGVVYCSPHMARIRKGDREMHFGEYFAMIEHPDIDSLAMTDMGPRARRDRTGDWLKITKRAGMEIPDIRFVEAWSIPAGKGEEKISLPLWHSVYELSAPGEGDVRRDGQTVDVKAAIEAAVFPYRDDTRFDIEIDIGDNLPEVTGDMAAFHFLCNSLVESAVNAMVMGHIAKDKGKLIIAARGVQQADGPKVEISFLDNGPEERALLLAPEAEEVGAQIETRSFREEMPQASSGTLPAGYPEDIAGDLIDTMTLNWIEAGRTAGGESKNTVLILSRSWIKDYEENLPRGDINRLLIGVRRFAESRGITFILTDDSEVISRAEKEAAKKANAGAQLIVIAGERVVNDMPTDLREEFAEKDNIFIAGVSGQTQRILDVVIISMKLAFSQYTYDLSWGDDIDRIWDPLNPNMLILKIPEAIPHDWGEPVEVYGRQREVLIKA